MSHFQGHSKHKEKQSVSQQVLPTRMDPLISEKPPDFVVQIRQRFQCEWWKVGGKADLVNVAIYTSVSSIVIEEEAELNQENKYTFDVDINSLEMNN